MAIKLEKGHGKDGNPSYPQVHAHPTNYNWRDDIERLTHRIVNREAFRGRIWINTYHHHPPGGPDDFWRHRDSTSFDVWGFDGRGDPLPRELGDRVYHVLFHDPDPPDIWWIIWQGEIWSRYQVPRRRPSPPGPAGSDPGHFSHIHVTYLDRAQEVDISSVTVERYAKPGQSWNSLPRGRVQQQPRPIFFSAVFTEVRGRG